MARRRRRIDSDVYDEIGRIVRTDDWTNATEVWRKVCDRFPDRAPSDRTVRDVVNELRPPDPSGPWQPGPDGDPTEDALILDALAAAWEHGFRRKRPLSREEARWIGWVRSGWPDLDLLTALVVASEYRARRQKEAATGDLDGFLAYAPWRSHEAGKRMQTAIAEGRALHPPVWIWNAAAIQNLRTEMDKAGGKATLQVQIKKEDQ